MLRLLFTLDYEIHGNGDGSPRDLMLDPTAKLMELLSEYGARLTIMADMAEILKFREHRDVSNGLDDYEYESIADQMRRAVTSGHDVQLHIHPSYFQAHHDEGRWVQDYSSYSLSTLPFDRINAIVRVCKAELEQILLPANEEYACIAFRSANWSMQPSSSIIRALLENGIQIDSSVFRHGRRSGVVNFDYRRAPSDVLPWRASDEDICVADPKGKLVEVPIYSEVRPLWAFLSAGRVSRIRLSRRHKHPVEVRIAGDPSVDGSRLRERIWRAWSAKHAWKLDFNQCGPRQMLNAIDRIYARHSGASEIPVVAIGHSKLFDRANQRRLEMFLRGLERRSDYVSYAAFGDLDLAGPLNNPGYCAV